jgi:hypothetical protein
VLDLFTEVNISDTKITESNKVNILEISIKESNKDQQQSNLLMELDWFEIRFVFLLVCYG